MRRAVSVLVLALAAASPLAAQTTATERAAAASVVARIDLSA